VAEKKSQEFCGAFSMKPLDVLVSLLWEFGFERKYLKRAALMTVCSVVTTPLHWYQRIRYRDVLKNTPVTRPPLIILGHWRTGTTRLHDLLCKDDQWGYPTLYQVAFPFCLVRPDLLKPLLAKAIPPTRPGDNMPLVLDNPQEMEMGLTVRSSYGFHSCYTFPGNGRKHLRRLTHEGLSPRQVQHWREQLMMLVRQATHLSGGKPLVMKEPPHAGRIPILLEMFPDAKFVFTRRNPYLMFLSTLKLWREATTLLTIKDVSDKDVVNDMVVICEGMMRKYLAERDLIPPGNLVELKFEDLDTDPMGTVRRIYAELDLPGFAAAEPKIRAYVEETAGYQKNAHVLTRDVIRKVNRHWGFVFEPWGYEQLGPAEVEIAPRRTPVRHGALGDRQAVHSPLAG
jgi:hypothetical protein